MRVAKQCFLESELVEEDTLEVRRVYEIVLVKLELHEVIELLRLYIIDNQLWK